MIEAKLIDIKLLQQNDGQIEGVKQNPRDLTQDGFIKAIKSIENFPEMIEVRTLVVVALEDKYVVIGGNQRLRALKHLEYTHAPCHVVNWSVDKINEFIVKDNLEYGQWNFDLLANEWDTELLLDWGMELPFADNSDDALQTLENEDFIPEIPQEPKTKYGDVWLLGNHRIMCGDSTMIDDVEKLMNGNKANMVFTDPPYGVKYSAGTGMRSKKIRPQMTMILNDDLNPEELTNFLLDVFANLLIVCNENAPFYVCNNWKCAPIFLQAFNEIDLKIDAWIIWNKEWMSLGFGHYRNNHEFIFYSQRNAESYAAHGSQQDVWSVQKLAPTEKIHTTEKPVALVDIAIANSSKKSDIVLDLFGGSGSTLIACEKANRINYSMELDPKYCDVIIARWEKITGKTAILENK
jgi:DNA modification methylase